MRQEGREALDEFSTGRKILFLAHPTLRPSPEDHGSMATARRASMGENWDSSSSLYRSQSHACAFPRILNQCHPVPGFIYERGSFADDGQTVIIPVRPRKRSAAFRSGCHQPEHPPEHRGAFCSTPSKEHDELSRVYGLV